MTAGRSFASPSVELPFLGPLAGWRAAMCQTSRTHLIVSLVAFLGIVQFLVAVAIAIQHYPADFGRGYSIFDNYLSDLGRSRTFWGQDNSVSAALFNRSAVILGASLLPFFVILPTTIGALRKAVWVSGILSALGLIGIGLTPYDLHFTAHMTALGLWIGPMVVLVVCHLIASGLDDEISLARKACALALVLALVTYALLGTQREGIIVQKLTVGVAMLWFLMIGVRVGGTVVRIVSTRNPAIEQQARRYMETLRYGHRRRNAKPAGRIGGGQNRGVVTKQQDRDGAAES
jgi:hypothetical membrane protein